MIHTSSRSAAFWSLDEPCSRPAFDLSSLNRMFRTRVCPSVVPISLSGSASACRQVWSILIAQTEPSSPAFAIPTADSRSEDPTSDLCSAVSVVILGALPLGVSVVALHSSQVPLAGTKITLSGGTSAMSISCLNRFSASSGTRSWVGALGAWMAASGAALVRPVDERCSQIPMLARFSARLTLVPLPPSVVHPLLSIPLFNAAHVAAASLSFFVSVPSNIRLAS